MQETQNTQFDYRSVSFGTPPKDGPPDRTGVRVTGELIKGFKCDLNRDLLSLALDLGFNDVTIQTEGRMAGLPEAIRNWGDKTGNLSFIKSMGMTISLWVRELQDHSPAAGKIAVGNQDLWRAVRDRYRRLLNETLPEVDYLVLTVVESEIKVTEDPGILEKLITEINQECRAAGKTLIFRTFVWYPVEMGVMELALGGIPDDVIIQSKCVPQDWHLRGVDNPLIGKAGNRKQYIEFDIAGEYNKLTNLACAFTEILERRLLHIESNGCTGVAIRVDRYGSTVYGQAQEANLWFLGLWTSGASRDTDTIWKLYTKAVFGEKAAWAMEAALRPSGEVVAEAICVERESYGYSRDYRPAGRNIDNPFDVLHSPAKWDPALLSTYKKITAGEPEIIRSKTRGFETARTSARQSLDAIDDARGKLPEGAYAFFSWKLEENLFHLDMFCNMELAWLKATRIRSISDEVEIRQLTEEVELHLTTIQRVYAARTHKKLEIDWRGVTHRHSPGSYHDWDSWMSAFCRYADLEPHYLSGTRVTESFDTGWKSHHGDPENGDDPEFDDSSWEHIELPHDWSIRGPYDEHTEGGDRIAFLPTGIGWYRKHFSISPEGKGLRHLILFDGVYRNSQVWINGHCLGRRPYGFIGFRYDLTPYLHFDAENVLAVRVDNEAQPSCRWYTGSGINRHTWLIRTASLHVDLWGVAVTTPESAKDRCNVRIATRVRNDDCETRHGSLRTVIVDPNGREAGRRTTDFQVTGEGAREIAQEIGIHDPILWDINQPLLYTAQSYIFEGEAKTDEYETPFGIREIVFDRDRGFFLNGRNLKMKGVCLHDDAGNLGTAVPTAVWERRLRVLKSMGCNAIRGSHNPKAPEFLDLCDRIGFLVIDEAFDKWLVGPRGYIDDFLEWWSIDLTDFVKRDRNHPSVVLWSVGNEVSEQDKHQGPQMLRALVSTVKRLDPSRPVTCGLRPMLNEQREQAVGPFAGLTDVVSLNYQEPWYREDRMMYHGRLIIGTEVLANRQLKEAKKRGL